VKRTTLQIRSILFIAALVACCGTCKAAVAWAGTAAECKVETGQEKAVAEFAFRNAGTRAVRVVSLRPSCDCISAQASKPSFAAGEAGVVRVEMALAGLVGRQEKMVNVTTDDPTEKPVELLLVVDIPEAVAIRPRALAWEVGAKLQQKVLTVTVAEPAKAVVTEARCDDARFEVSLEPGAKRGVYRLRVQPVAIGSPVRTTVRLTTMVEGCPLVSVIYVAVK